MRRPKPQRPSHKPIHQTKSTLHYCPAAQEAETATRVSDRPVSELISEVRARVLDDDADGDMSVVILDGSTVRSFVADEAAFARSVDARFAALDANGDGMLSRAELRRALESFRLLDGAGFGSAEAAPLPAEVAALYDAVFEQFDADHSGAVDHAEFRDEMRRIMLAVDDGLGSQPLQVAVDDEGGSFLLEAAEHEAAMIAAKVQDERDKAAAEADGK